jgi:hypothetical protein
MAATGLMRVNTWPYSSCGLPSSEITFAEQTKKAGYLNGYIGRCLSCFIFSFCKTYQYMILKQYEI